MNSVSDRLVMPQNIFINYRRGEDEDTVDRLYDQLESVFDQNLIFIDAADILASKDFMAKCDIFLAVVGKNWVDVQDQDGVHLLQNPNDVVRIEIEAALQHGKHVIPILVDGAEMPAAEKLPESLALFSRRDAFRLTHDRFNSDVRGLVTAIGKLRTEEQARQAAEENERWAESILLAVEKNPEPAQAQSEAELAEARQVEAGQAEARQAEAVQRALAARRRAQAEQIQAEAAQRALAARQRAQAEQIQAEEAAQRALEARQRAQAEQIEVAKPDKQQHNNAEQPSHEEQKADSTEIEKAILTDRLEKEEIGQTSSDEEQRQQAKSEEVKSESEEAKSEEIAVSAIEKEPVDSEQAPEVTEEASNGRVEKGRVSGSFRAAALGALAALVVVGGIATPFIKEFLRPAEVAAPANIMALTQPLADQEPQSDPAVDQKSPSAPTTHQGPPSAPAADQKPPPSAPTAHEAPQSAPAAHPGPPSAPVADQQPPPAPPPVRQRPPSGPAAPPQPIQAVAAIPQRAALLVRAPDDQKQIKTYAGTVIWRQEPVSSGQAEPSSLSVQADINVPELKLQATVTLQKNEDPTLPASHIFEVRFMPADGSPIPGVKQIDVPELRDTGQIRGDALSGVPAQITQNYFMVGLTQDDAATARNIDLIKSREWFDIPILLGDDRIAKLTFEKGATGDEVVVDAIAAWR